MIVSFKSKLLKKLWQTGDISLLPNLYVYQVVEILDFLDDAKSVHDLLKIGEFQVQEYQPTQWALTVTVNNVEPIGSVVCHFYNGNAHEVDLNVYN